MAYSDKTWCVGSGGHKYPCCLLSPNGVLVICTDLVRFEVLAVFGPYLFTKMIY